MDITNIIDRMEALVGTSPKVPATRSRLVDSEKMAELVEQLRLSIPQDVKAAQEVLDRKDTILNQAQIDARRTRNEAEEEFMVRLDQSEVLTAARNRAELLMVEADEKATRLLERVENESRNTRAEVDAYVVQSLRNLEQELTTVLTAVRRGLDNLGALVRA